MKNIIYLVISSVFVLGIVSIVISLFQGDKKLIGQVSNMNNTTQNISADGMVQQGITYTGADVLSFVRYYADTDVELEIKFKTGGPIAIKNDSHRKDRIIDVEEKFKESYTNASEEISYMDAKFDVTDIRKGMLKFRIRQ